MSVCRPTYRATAGQRTVIVFAFVVTAACGGGGDTGTQPTVTCAVSSVSIGGVPATMIVGQVATLSATAAASNCSAAELSATWSSTNAGTLTVTQGGVVSAVAAGNATITATIRGASGSVVIVVSQVPVASVSVTPPNVSVEIGEVSSLVATTRDANGATLTGRSITWTSGNPSIVSVSQTGTITGVAEGGPVQVSASTEGRSGSSQVTVVRAVVATISISPATVSLGVGATAQMQATLRDARGAALSGRVVTWTTSNTAVATVSATGAVTGVALGGPVTITATGEGRSATAQVTVVPPPVASLTIGPSTAAVIVGGSAPLFATTRDAAGNTLTGRVVTWTSSDPSLVSVSAGGVVSGVALGGPVTVTATSEGKVATSRVTVVPPIGSGLSGLWYHNRTGGRWQAGLQGSIVLVRDPSCDSGGFTCYTGTPVLDVPRGAQDEWAFGLRGSSEIVVCLGSCGILSCVGSLSSTQQISTNCVFVNLAVGPLTASRSKP